MQTLGRRRSSTADGSGSVISSLTRRFVARSVAYRDEPPMNAKQLLGLFTEVPGRLENAHARLDAAVFAALRMAVRSLGRRGPPKPARPQPGTIQSSLGKVPANSP